MKKNKKIIRLKRKQKKQITGRALIVVITASIAIMLLTPGFDIKEINVYGNSVLKEEDIIQSSGIVKGINIFGVSLKNAKDSIGQMGYIESVKVKRNLPDTIDITVVEAVGVAYIVAKNGYVIITADGRSLDVINPEELKGNSQNEKDELNSLPIIKGIKNIKYKIGEKIKSDETEKLEILFECLKEFSKYGYVFNMKTIDISDVEDIRFLYNSGKLSVSLGDRSKLGYKMECFGPILETIGSDPQGFVDLERLTYRKPEIQEKEE